MCQAGFRARFRAGFYAKLELFRASRRFSLLQTLCTRRYEKRTQQAELVGKTAGRPVAGRPEAGRPDLLNVRFHFF